MTDELRSSARRAAGSTPVVRHGRLKRRSAWKTLGKATASVLAVALVSGSAVIWSLSRRKPVGHGDVAPAAEPAGVITTAIAAVTPPPTGAAAPATTADATAATDLKSTIPAPAGTVADPARPATV